MSTPIIQAIGTAVPVNKICQQDHYDILESANGLNRAERLTLRQIYSKSGITYRHSVLSEFGAQDAEDNQLFHPSGRYPQTDIAQRMQIYEQHAGDLCAEACRNAFAQLDLLKKEEVTHVVSFSCTGMHAPGLDIEITEKLGLSRNVERTCINFMGCYAAINALKYAYHIVRSEPDAVVLLAGVELCSLHYQKSNEANQMVANALFSDGAGAAIVSARSLSSDAQKLKLALKSFYAEFEQSAGNEMVWRIGNLGFDLRLTPEVPKVVKGNIHGLVEKLLQKANMQQADIDLYAIHPGGIKILEACEQALGISKEHNKVSYSVLNDFGNMSSVTVLFVLERYLQQLTQADKGKKVLSCAFGPGITVESLIAEIV